MEICGTITGREQEMIVRYLEIHTKHCKECGECMELHARTKDTLECQKCDYTLEVVIELKEVTERR